MKERWVVHRRLDTCRGWSRRRCKCPWRGLGHRRCRRKRDHRWGRRLWWRRRRWRCEPRRRHPALVDTHRLGEACRRDRRWRSRGRRRGHRGLALVDPHRLGEAGRRGRYRRPRRRCSPTTPAQPGGDRRRGPRRGDTTGPGQGTGPGVGPTGGERVPAERGRIGGSTTASVGNGLNRSRSRSEEGVVVVEQ